MNWIAIGLVVIAKFVVPLLIIPFPFAAGWANFVLDTVDGDLLIPLGLDDGPYQLIDKGADWFTYIGMLFAARQWQISRTVVVLFVFRSRRPAALLHHGCGDRVLLVPELPGAAVPDLRDHPPFQAGRRGADIYMRHRAGIWVFVVLYKLQDEWVTHVGNIDRTELITDLFS